MSLKRFLNGTVARLAFAGLLAAPHAANAETLADALTKAYGGNPTLQSARATMRATDENMAQALAGYRPSLSASGSTAARQMETNSDAGNKKSLNPRTVALTLTQPLYSGGQTVAAVSSAANTISAQRARLMGTEQQVMLAAATAYMDVLRDQAVLELNVNNEQVLGRHLEATRDRFNVGEITRTDVHQAEARLAGATANRIQAEGTLEASRATYANVVGEAPGTLEKPNAVAMPLPPSLGEALKAADDSNPNIIAAVFAEKAALADVDSAKGQLLPSIDLTGSAGRNVETTSRDYWSNTYEAKVTLSVPLYEAGSVYSQVRQARQVASASRLDADQARRDAAEQVRQAWQNLEAQKARIDSIETQVRAAQTALEGVQREASVGSRTVLDVLDAEQELLNARVNLVTTQRDETVAALTLLSSVGRLTAKDLNLAVDLYDTGRHYQDVQGKWFGTDMGDSGGQ